MPIICCKGLELSEPISPEVNYLIAGGKKKVSGTDAARLGTEKTLHIPRAYKLSADLFTDAFFYT